MFWLSRLRVFSPFLGVGIKVGNRTGLNYWVFVVMGIFLARCMSDEWGGMNNSHYFNMNVCFVPS